MKTYNIQISLNDAEDQDAPAETDTFMVCVYADDGDGSPLYEYYEEKDVSDSALQTLLENDFEELGASMADAELIRDY